MLPPPPPSWLGGGDLLITALLHRGVHKYTHNFAIVVGSHDNVSVYLTFYRLLIGTSHIILDEIHERDVLSDFLIIIVRDLLPRR